MFSYADWEEVEKALRITGLSRDEGDGDATGVKRGLAVIGEGCRR